MESELKKLFCRLNHECTYLVLRNWDDVFDDNVYATGHDDIDILCDNKERFIRLTGAKSIHKNKYRDNYIVPCGTIQVRFDIRWVGDGYYPTEWEKEMLENRTLIESGIYIMSKEDYCYSLAYHALLQKPKLSKIYLIKVTEAFLSLSKQITIEKESDMMSALKHFMAEKGFKYIVPKDPAVYINWAKVKEIEHHYQLLPMIRRISYRLLNRLGVK